MKPLFFEFIIFSLCVFACTGCGRPALPEGDGIVAMTPALTEVVLELGLGDELRATSPYTTDPRAATARRISSNGALEMITFLRPKLVLTQGTETQLPHRLAKLQIEAKVLPMTTLEDIENAMRTVGAATQSGETAQRRIEDFRTDLSRNQARYGHLSPRPDVLIIVDRLDMRMQQFYIAQRPAFLAELFEGCGMSVISGGDAPWARIDAEMLYQLNPEYIAFLERTPESAGETKKSFAGRFSGLSAVKNDRLFVYGDADITIPGPNSGRRQTGLCEQIHAFLGHDTRGTDAIFPTR